LKNEIKQRLYPDIPEFPETPEHIVLEWELINLIISYTFISYDYNEINQVFFTSKEIKKYYRDINYENFNKVYGKNGIYTLLSFRNGVEYHAESDTWYIYPRQFLKHLSEEYKKDEDEYGKDFDKPWIKNLRELK